MTFQTLNVLVGNNVKVACPQFYSANQYDSVNMILYRA